MRCDRPVVVNDLLDLGSVSTESLDGLWTTLSTETGRTLGYDVDAWAGHVARIAREMSGYRGTESWEYG